jgi:3-hydroxybutyryl-CoA dehydrogenase
MKADHIKKIGVVGAGLMGNGIAQGFALAGYQVYIHDLSQEKLQQALKNMRANLQMLVKIGMIKAEQIEPTLSNIHPNIALAEAVGDCDLVIESVFENLELKRQVFAELDRVCPARTILASNTSTLMPSKLASATKRPDKVLVAHYYNPPYLVPLVEVVRHKETAEETVKIVYDLLLQAGKKPALIQKETPGFIGNRLQAALVREALSIVDKGIASPQDIDTVVRYSLGPRWAAAGPFEVFEIAGWDFILSAWPYLASDLESSSEVPSVLREKVARDEFGIKTGKGFYEWTPETADALRQRIAQALVKIASWEQK